MELKKTADGVKERKVNTFKSILLNKIEEAFIKDKVNLKSQKM